MGLDKLNYEFNLSEFDKENLVVMLHGFFSSKESKTYIDLQKDFDSLKISSVRFDFFGHNSYKANISEITITKCVSQVNNLIDLFKKKGFKNIILFGCSFGGQIGYIVSSQRDDISRLILKCPVFSYTDKLNSQRDIKYWKKTGVISNYNNVAGRSLNYSFYEDSLKYDFESLVKKISCKTFIVHGTYDECVNYNQSVKAESLIKDCRLVLISNENHNFSNKIESYDLVKDLLVREVKLFVNK